MYYPMAAAGTYFLGRNILLRGTSYAIDYLLNANADPYIKETHTVQTIHGMLKTYSNLPKEHPAYESKCAVEHALRDLQDVVHRARLRLSVHESGWITRWRCFDASKDNACIEKKARELMSRLDIFTKLINLNVICIPCNNQYQDYNYKEGNAKKTYTIADKEDIVPIEPMTTLAVYDGCNNRV